MDSPSYNTYAPPHTKTLKMIEILKEISHIGTHRRIRETLAESRIMPNGKLLQKRKTMSLEALTGAIRLLSFNFLSLFKPLFSRAFKMST